MLTKVENTCAFCGAIYWREPCYIARSLRNGHQPACSKGCSNRYFKKLATGDKNPAWAGGKITKLCMECNKTFKVRRGGTSSYCSRSCYAIAMSKSAFGVKYVRSERNFPLYTAIAVKKIGRNLLPNEVVHHIDGDYKNNSPDNLQIMTNSEHTAMHAKERHQLRKQMIKEKQLCA